MINRDQSSLLMQAAKGVLLGLLGAIGGKILMLLLQIMVSRLYGPKYYGLFITGILVCHMVQSISALGLHKGGMRFVAIAHEKSDYNMILDVFQTVMIFPLMVGTLMACLTYFLSSFLAVTCFKDTEMTIVLKLFSVAIPFYALLRVTSELSRGFKTTKYSVMIENLLLHLLQIIFFIAFYAFGYGYLSVVYSFIVSAILCSLLMVKAVWQQIKTFIGINAFVVSLKNIISFPKKWKTILLFSIPLTPFGLLWICGNSMDIIMLNILSSSKGVGEYAAASRYIMFFLTISSSLNFIFGPLIAGQYGVNNNAHLSVLYKTATRWMLFLALPTFIFQLLAREQLMMLFGDQFLKFGPTVLGILVAGSLFTALSGSAGILLVVSENQYIELGCLTGYMLLNMMLNLILIPKYGVIGAALGTIISNIVTVLLRILLIYLKLKLHPFSKHLVFPVTTTAILCIFGLLAQTFLKTGNSINLGLSIASGCLVALSIFMNGLDSHDKELYSKIKIRDITH